MKNNKKTKKCFECDTTKSIEQHHVVPRSLGGTRTLPLCSDCHAKVHDRKAISISELTRKAFEEKKKRGEYLGGIIPYGWYVKNEKLIPSKRESKIILQIIAMREQGLTFRAIVADLNRRKIKPRSSEKWDVSTVFRICRNAEENKFSHL